MMTTRDSYGRDLARTLPSFCYTDECVLDLERRELFHKSWIYVCHESQLAHAGQFVTTDIYGQDVFVVRGPDGELRAFYNVCPHRGHRLVEGTGKRRIIVCPYHAWSYSLDGALVRSPGSENSDVGNADICLSAVRVETILSFVFINLDKDAPPLAEHAAGLADHIRSVRPELGDYRLRSNIDYFGGAYACNWKIVLDNFLECYHCGIAHRSFGDMMDVSGNRFSLHGNYSYQFLPTAGKAKNLAYPLDLEEDDLDGHFWFLFPNTIFSIFPGTKNFSVSRADPVSVEQTTRFFQTLTPEDINTEREAARSKWGLEVVNEEDKALCENVQRGMRQNGFDRGYYLIDPEQGGVTEEAVKFFHDLYRSRMQPVMSSSLT